MQKKSESEKPMVAKKNKGKLIFLSKCTVSDSNNTKFNKKKVYYLVA